MSTETQTTQIPRPRIEDFIKGVQQAAVELSQRTLTPEQFAELRRIDQDLTDLIDWIDEGDEV